MHLYLCILGPQFTGSRPLSLSLVPRKPQNSSELWTPHPLPRAMYIPRSARWNVFQSLVQGSDKETNHSVLSSHLISFSTRERCILNLLYMKRKTERKGWSVLTTTMNGGEQLHVNVNLHKLKKAATPRLHDTHITISFCNKVKDRIPGMKKTRKNIGEHLGSPVL